MRKVKEKEWLEAPLKSSKLKNLNWDNKLKWQCRKIHKKMLVVHNFQKYMFWKNLNFLITMQLEPQNHKIQRR
jgi:hypothetical protein